MDTGRPDKVCGIHFFNPAPMMALVEVVRAITTSDETIAEATAFATTCGKNAVQVKDQAGFIVNALLFPYLNNAVQLFDAGVATRDDIDAAMKGGCNFPMGPLELLDLVGLDTSLAILEALYAEFKDPNYAPAPLLRRMVSAERLGRKTAPRVLRLPEVEIAPPAQPIPRLVRVGDQYAGNGASRAQRVHPAGGELRRVLRPRSGPAPRAWPMC